MSGTLVVNVLVRWKHEWHGESEGVDRRVESYSWDHDSLDDALRDGFGSGANWLAVFLIILRFTLEAKARGCRGFEAEFRDGERWDVQEPSVWIRVQDSGGMGVADRGDERARG